MIAQAVRCPLPLVLASASPRREKILRDAGYAFETRDPGEVESAIAAAPTPEALALAKARLKARAVAADWPDPAVVVGADTICVLGDEVIGKPLDRIDAQSILKRLSGTRHRVVTGLCLWHAPGETHAPHMVAESTWVRMAAMSDAQIDAYVASGEADGKAGAYAIQETGDRYVEGLEGSFHNVVGFPLERFELELPRALRGWGVT